MTQTDSRKVARPYTKVYLTALQKEQAKRLALQAGVTESELFRRLLMDGTTFQPSQERARHITELVAVSKTLHQLNADLARLGNLLKLALSEPDWAESAPDIERASDLMSATWSLQGDLREAIQDLKTTIRTL